jgi:hypothetical protein
MLGKHPRAYVGTGVFLLLLGGVFALLGQNMDGAFRLGMTGAGALTALFGAWYIVYGLGLRGATGTPR